MNFTERDKELWNRIVKRFGDKSPRIGQIIYDIAFGNEWTDEDLDKIYDIVKIWEGRSAAE